MLSSNLKQSIPVTHTRPETPSFEDSCHSGTTMVSSLSSDGSAYNGTVIDSALFGKRSTTLKDKEAQPKQSRLFQFWSWCCGGFSKPDLGSIRDRKSVV